MAKLQSLGQFTDGDAIAPGKTLDCQQSLMMLRRDAGGLGRLFTETHELPQRVSKRGERFVLRFDQWSGVCHRAVMLQPPWLIVIVV